MERGVPFLEWIVGNTRLMMYYDLVDSWLQNDKVWEIKIACIRLMCVAVPGTNDRRQCFRYRRH